MLHNFLGFKKVDVFASFLGSKRVAIYYFYFHFFNSKIVKKGHHTKMQISTTVAFLKIKTIELSQRIIVFIRKYNPRLEGFSLFKI